MGRLSKSGGGTRKYRRNIIKCKRYREEKRREKNKRRRQQNREDKILLGKERKIQRQVFVLCGKTSLYENENLEKTGWKLNKRLSRWEIKFNKKLEKKLKSNVFNKLSIKIDSYRG